MRSLILFLFLMLTVRSVFADVSEKHFQELCESPENQSLMGEKGSCQIVIHSETVTEGQGVCTGKLRSMPCEVRYLSNAEGTEMLLLCGRNLLSPEIEKDMVADTYSYKVNTVIKTSMGKTIVKKNNVQYQIIDGSFIQILIQKSATQSFASMLVSLNSGIESFTDVQCR